ncbi:unnamed protein product [Ilex paraguariensis]|uniref:Uncharacterized protein n=1 Tax=Ilex paraguariensis TaxID=185542 RepID=A0ABC8TM01_9AQUA
MIDGCHMICKAETGQSSAEARVPAQLENLADQHSGGDIENPVHGCISVVQNLHSKFWKLTGKLVPQIKHIQEIKVIHHQAVQLVKLLCMEIVKLDYSKAASIFGVSLKVAAITGVREVVEEILSSFPGAIYLKNEFNQTIFHLAIVNRRENIFNLVYQFEEFSNLFISTVDSTMNNGLHLAGCLESQQKLNLRARAAGAALQMQLELQWFKVTNESFL